MAEQVYFKSKKDSVWRKDHATLKDFYHNGGEVDPKTGKFQYDPKYYSFDEMELTIDPDESMESVEKYDAVRQRSEILKCSQSFFYFCHKYVKILHPMKGLIPFVLYNYQRKVIRDYEKYRFNIISKFRQGGLTTVTLLWGLWRCMFDLDQQIMLLSKTDREATDIGMLIDRSCENFPDWLRPKKDSKWNDHLKMFTNTGSTLKFYSPEAARGKAVTFLIVDEAAFVDDMDKHWKAMWPVLSTGGSCTLVSTVNGLGNWYERTYHDAKEGRNKFHIIDLDYWEHPDYNDENWVKEQKAQLGEKGFLQEVLRHFLGSGETYFSSRILTQLAERTRNNNPIKKLYPRWANKAGRISQIENEYNKGAFWIWKLPVEGREYIIAADCADGQEENNDSSCFQILDTVTMEQVAEFYSNIISPNEFAQVLSEVGLHYNNALLAVETNGIGSAVMNTLLFVFYYENLYYEPNKVNAKPGIKMGAANRPEYLEALKNALSSQTVKINSLRFAMEIQTFEFNAVTKKAQARKGEHDDAIISMAIALFIRNSMTRNLPVGAETPKNVSSAIKNQVYEEIRRELLEGSPSKMVEEIDLIAPEEISMPISLIPIRKNNLLLREFGW